MEFDIYKNKNVGIVTVNRKVYTVKRLRMYLFPLKALFCRY